MSETKNKRVRTDPRNPDVQGREDPVRELYCGECKWFAGSMGDGLCRYHPPPSNPDYEDSYAIWPRVVQYDWCSKAEWNGLNMDEGDTQ